LPGLRRRIELIRRRIGALCRRFGQTQWRNPSTMGASKRLAADMNEPNLPILALTILSADLLRYTLAAGAVWVVVDVLFARRLLSRRILDGQRRPNQIGREITYSLSTVVIFAANGLMIWLLHRAGHLKLYDNMGTLGWVWWAFSLVSIAVVHDAYFYWTHRLMHRPSLFRWVHARHHASVHPTPWATYAFHPLDAAIQASFLPLYLLVVPTHASVVGLFLLHMIVRNAVGHCAHELLPWQATRAGWLRWITPVSHHHFHHARNRGNFGLYFTWWDRWCGTEDGDYLRNGDARFGPTRRPGALS
jgi:Delta7-sterol 5-desaturase